MANHAQKIDARATLITLMLREDHQKVRQLFDQFHETTKTYENRDIVAAALAALEILVTLKEELIYPAWREHMDEPDLVDEALKEHHVVHMLIKELKNMNPEDKRYSPKLAVLGEYVQHYINEDERKMFPLAEKADLDWERLTTHVVERRQSLEHKTLWILGVPVMVSASKTVCATRAVFFGR